MGWILRKPRSTGWIDRTHLLGAAVAEDNIGTYQIKRDGSMVTIRLTGVTCAGGGSNNLAWNSLPAGFQGPAGGLGALREIGSNIRSNGSTIVLVDGAHLRIMGARTALWETPSTIIPAGHIVNGEFSYQTDDAWPGVIS